MIVTIHFRSGATWTEAEANVAFLDGRVTYPDSDVFLITTFREDTYWIPWTSIEWVRVELA